MLQKCVQWSFHIHGSLAEQLWFTNKMVAAGFGFVSVSSPSVAMLSMSGLCSLTKVDLISVMSVLMAMLFWSAPQIHCFGVLLNQLEAILLLRNFVFTARLSSSSFINSGKAFSDIFIIRFSEEVQSCSIT